MLLFEELLARQPWRDAAAPDDEPTWHDVPWDDDQRIPDGSATRELVLGLRPFAGVRVRLQEPRVRTLALVAERRDTTGNGLVSLGVLADTMPLIAAWLRPRVATARVCGPDGAAWGGLPLASGETWDAGPNTGDPVWANLCMYGRFSVQLDPPHHPNGDGPRWAIALKSTALDARWPPFDAGNVWRCFEWPRHAADAVQFVSYGNGVAWGSGTQRPDDAQFGLPRATAKAAVAHGADEITQETEGGPRATKRARRGSDGR